MGKKILLVEEDQQFCKLVVPVLEGRGHKVLQAQNGQAGAEIVEKEALDLVVVCCPMLDGDALEWISRLRETGNNIEIVFVAAALQEVRLYKQKLEKELGVALVLHKPVIPFVFGAQVEARFASDEADAQARKLKDFETMFLALVTKYSRVLPSKLSDLASAIEKARSNTADEAALAEVKSQAHKIKGTGGSLGFRQVAEAMSFIENAAITMREKHPDEQKLVWSEVERKLLDAQQAGEQEAKELAQVVSDKDAVETAQSPSMARILVVDNDIEFLDIVEKLGKERLVEIIRASSYNEAMDRACLLPLDAALINVVPEEPDESFRLARELRGLPSYDTLPLAFISGSALIKDRVEAAHAGASLYLDKPLESDSLEKAVQHLVAIRQGGRPRVLVVDDDEFFASTVALTLRNEGMIVRILLDPAKILDTMQEFPPDMLLLDVMMPGVNGFEVCRMLRQVPRWQDLPIIFLTGQTGVDARVEAFRSGGDDYLPKPVVNEELLTRVKVRLDRSRLLKERSDKDTISGLLLRRAFSEQLSGMIAEAQRTGLKFTICLLDVDNFKKVNDTYGHLAGDRVLAGLGQLLARRFRVDDLRGRWGGEEFILAFRREAKETMQAAVTRVLIEFRETIFTGDHGEQFHVSFSGGLASFPDDGVSVYELLKTADRRLYYAKHTGRNQVVFSDQVTEPAKATS
jgi:diguanylate cyclase (GGDEF)-like protein